MSIMTQRGAAGWGQFWMLESGWPGEPSPDRQQTGTRGVRSRKPLSE